MSQRRMIDDSMWSNEKFAEMPLGARLLQIGIINHADDQGRVKANPAYLRAQIFPYDDIGIAQVQEWLNLIAANKTIILYEVDGKQYAQLVNWWQYQTHQYAQPSQHPRPHGWKDRIRKTLTKGVIVTCNWLKVNGEPIDDTCDQDGRLLVAKQVSQPASTANDTLESDDDASPDTTYRHDVDSPEYSGESTGEDTRSIINLIEDQLEDQSSAREANTNGKTDDDDRSDDLMPGQFLRTLLEGKGFMYFDADFSQRASVLEAQYSTPELIRAVEQTHKYHLKKIGEGGRGITSPLAYMAQILSGNTTDDDVGNKPNKAQDLAERVRNGKPRTANDYYRNGRKHDGVGYVPGTAKAFLRDYEGAPA